MHNDSQPSGRGRGRQSGGGRGRGGGAHGHPPSSPSPQAGPPPAPINAMPIDQSMFSPSAMLPPQQQPQQHTVPSSSITPIYPISQSSLASSSSSSQHPQAIAAANAMRSSIPSMPSPMSSSQSPSHPAPLPSPSAPLQQPNQSMASFAAPLGPALPNPNNPSLLVRMKVPAAGQGGRPNPSPISPSSNMPPSVPSYPFSLIQSALPLEFSQIPGLEHVSHLALMTDYFDVSYEEMEAVKLQFGLLLEEVRMQMKTIEQTRSHNLGMIEGYHNMLKSYKQKKDGIDGMGQMMQQPLQISGGLPAPSSSGQNLGFAAPSPGSQASLASIKRKQSEISPNSAQSQHTPILSPLSISTLPPSSSSIVDASVSGTMDGMKRQRTGDLPAFSAGPSSSMMSSSAGSSSSVMMSSSSPMSQQQQYNQMMRQGAPMMPGPSSSSSPMSPLVNQQHVSMSQSIHRPMGPSPSAPPQYSQMGQRGGIQQLNANAINLARPSMPSSVSSALQPPLPVQPQQKIRGAKLDKVKSRKNDQDAARRANAASSQLAGYSDEEDDEEAEKEKVHMGRVSRATLSSTVFWSLVSLHFEPITEEKLESLLAPTPERHYQIKQKDDVLVDNTGIIPPLGPHYLLQWREEDLQAMAEDEVPPVKPEDTISTPVSARATRIYSAAYKAALSSTPPSITPLPSSIVSSTPSNPSLLPDPIVPSISSSVESSPPPLTPAGSVSGSDPETIDFQSAPDPFASSELTLQSRLVAAMVDASTLPPPSISIKPLQSYASLGHPRSDDYHEDVISSSDKRISNQLQCMGIPIGNGNHVSAASSSSSSAVVALAAPVIATANTEDDEVCVALRSEHKDLLRVIRKNNQQKMKWYKLIAPCIPDEQRRGQRERENKEFEEFWAKETSRPKGKGKGKKKAETTTRTSRASVAAAASASNTPSAPRAANGLLGSTPSALLVPSSPSIASSPLSPASATLLGESSKLAGGAGEDASALELNSPLAGSSLNTPKVEDENAPSSASSPSQLQSALEGNNNANEENENDEDEEEEEENEAEAEAENSANNGGDVEMVDSASKSAEKKSSKSKNNKKNDDASRAAQMPQNEEDMDEEEEEEEQEQEQARQRQQEEEDEDASSTESDSVADSDDDDDDVADDLDAASSPPTVSAASQQQSVPHPPRTFSRKNSNSSNIAISSNANDDDDDSYRASGDMDADETSNFASELME